MDFPSEISMQFVQTEQGVGVGPLSQFIDFAKILAVEVLPTPLGPENKMA